MGVVYCAFDKCGNKRMKHNTGISFFSFPRDEELLKKWLEFFNKHNKIKLDAKSLLRDKMKLCHLHFLRSQVVVKSNSDRSLVRNSVPRCPPGVIDKAYGAKKAKTKKKTGKIKGAASVDAPQKEATVKQQSDTNVPATPLYHSINGYVVDLRIAAQQETFRLPNGKLIQVRKQPKTGEGSKSPYKVQAVGKPVSKAHSTPSSKQQNSDNKTNTSASKASKTYSNRRTTSPNASSRPAPGPRASLQASAVHAPLASQPPSISYIAAPPLTALQALISKTHDNSKFGNHQKKFENRLISAAETALHVVAKVSNLVNSNPFKSATSELDLKDLYMHVSYILKYAIDRFTGLEEDCISDIKQMGFTDSSDLGPVLEKQTPAHAAASSSHASNTNVSKQSNGKAANDEDDDCTIVEQRTDLIEIVSDNENDEDEPKKYLEVRQVRICSDTESVHGADSPGRDQETTFSTIVHELPADRVDDETLALHNSTSEPASTELVMKHEVEETTTEITDVIQNIFYTNETSHSSSTVNHSTRHSTIGDGSEFMEVQEIDEVEEDDEILAVEISEQERQLEEAEETEELIEIIEGDMDHELDDGHEYKVVEIIDGDFYLVSSENN